MLCRTTDARTTCACVLRMARWNDESNFVSIASNDTSFGSIIGGSRHRVAIPCFFDE